MMRKKFGLAVFLLGLLGCSSAPRRGTVPVSVAELGGGCPARGLPDAPVLEAGGWMNENTPVTIWAVPRARHTENEPSSNVGVLARIDFYAQAGETRIKLPWSSSSSAYFNQPRFLFGKGGRMLVLEEKGKSLLDWVFRRRKLKVSQFDLPTQRAVRLQVLYENRKFNFSDLAVSPDVDHIAWATKAGVAVANTETGAVRRYLEGWRVREPWFSTDGKLVGVWALPPSSAASPNAQLVVVDVDSGAVISRDTHTLTVDAFQDAAYAFFEAGIRGRLSSFMIYPMPSIEADTSVLWRRTFTWSGQSYRFSSLRWDRNFCIGPVFSDNLTKVGFHQQGNLLTWTNFGGPSISGFHRNVNFGMADR